MKRVILMFYLLVSSISIYSQKEPVKSNAGLFLSQKGIFFEKEYVPVGKFKDVELSGVVVSTLNNESELKYVRFSYNGISKYSGKKTFYAILDYDEIDDMVKSIDFIIEKTTAAFPDRYIELSYISRSDFKLFAYTKKRSESWMCGLHIDKYEDMSMVYFPAEGLTELKSLLVKAQSLL